MIRNLTALIMKVCGLGDGNTNDLTNCPFKLANPVLKTNPTATFYYPLKNLLVSCNISISSVTLI